MAATSDKPNLPTVILGEGLYRHPAGALQISRGKRLICVTFTPRGEWPPNAAHADWFFDEEGNFDGTGTELVDSVPDQED